MYASRNLATGTIVGVETGLPVASALDLATVLAAHTTAQSAIGSGVKAQSDQRTGPDGLLPVNANTRTM